MPLFMIRNDITKMQVDAVVNPSNRELMPGRGTSMAIYQAAGYEPLMKACRKIGICEPGCSVMTKGFDLPAKYIIHAVCPQWTGEEAQKALLKQAYRSALQMAAKHRLRSVAFPLLSSGFYGWPKADAFHTATTVISEFLLESDMTVYLVLYDHESVEVSRKLFEKIEEYIDDHYVETHDEGYIYAGAVHLEEGSVIRDNRVHEETAVYGSVSAAAKAQMALKPSAVLPSPKVPPSPAAPAVSGTRKGIPREKNSAAVKSSCVSKARKLDDLMSHMDETFSQMLLRLIDERGLKDSTVYHKANIDRRLFSKIRKDINYAPTKKTVLAFAIALELTLDEAKDLLMKAGFAFSGSSKFDVIVSFFIENRNYDIFEINEALFVYGQPILGE